MKELSKFQLWMIVALLATGIAMLAVNLITVIFVSLGFTFITMAVVLLVLECSPRVWYWWVGFRWGYYVTLPPKTYMVEGIQIDDWLEENVRFKFMHTNNGEAFFFLRNSDAMGFKLRWV